jgi:L,D-transpeptidase catalytic domain
MRHLPLIGLCLFLANCSFQSPISPAPQPKYQIHPTRFAALNPAKSHLEIDLTTQKARLLNRADEVVIETDVSTGKPGHETPQGRFRIIEKIEDKRSNRYGRYHDLKTGVDLGASDEHLEPPQGAIYEGYQMPFWMRLTASGIGMHVGYVVPGSACSHGCVRVPKDIQPLIFEKCCPGTKVEIIRSPALPSPPAPPLALVPTNPLATLFRTR